MRTIDHVTHAGQHLALVPLGRFGSKGYAVIEAEDLAMLEASGLSLRWNRNQLTGTIFAPCRKGQRWKCAGRPSPSRPEAGGVKFLNGDPVELRRHNLFVIDGDAIRRDRGFLTPRLKDKMGPAIEHAYDNPAQPTQAIDHYHSRDLRDWHSPCRMHRNRARIVVYGALIDLQTLKMATSYGGIMFNINKLELNWEDAFRFLGILPHSVTHAFQTFPETPDAKTLYVDQFIDKQLMDVWSDIEQANQGASALVSP